MFGINIWAKLDWKHLGISVPPKGNAQCWASALAKSAQSASLDSGALQDYPPTERPHEGKMWPATRNVGKKMWVTCMCWRCLRSKVGWTEVRWTQRAKVTVVPWAASQGSSEKKLRTVGAKTDLHEHKVFLKALERTDVFPLLFSACVASLPLDDDYEVAHLVVGLVEF